MPLSTSNLRRISQVRLYIYGIFFFHILLIYLCSNLYQEILHHNATMHTKIGAYVAREDGIGEKLDEYLSADANELPFVLHGQVCTAFYCTFTYS
jgi:hypothetical protein